METVKTETVSSSDFAGRILLRQELLFWITACVLLFIFLDTAGLRDGELFRAEVCREMLLTRSWFQPVFNWETVNNISFLGYWLTAPFIWLFGYTEAAVRMPGVLAALACLYGVRMTGKVLFNEKIAYMAGWMLLGSVGFLLWGRNGSIAMPGMAASILAVGWFFRMEGKSVFFTMLVFYLLCFAGVLCSSISALFVPVTVVFFWCFAERNKAPNWYLKNLGAFCTAALFFVFLTLLPVLLSENRTAEAAEVLKNLALSKNAWRFTPADWRKYGLSCLWYLPKMLLPWSPLLLAGAAGLAKNWNNLSAGIRASAAGSILAVIICILTFKEQSLLAAVPLVLLLGCGGLTGPGANKWIFPAVSIIYYAMLIFSSVFFCSVIAYPLWRKLIAFSPPLPLLLWPAAMGVLAWFALFLDHRRNSILTVATGLPHRLGSSILAGAVLTGCCMSVLQPIINSEFGCGKKFFRRLQRQALRELPDYSSHKVIFYRSRIPAGFLFYNHLFSPVTRVANLRETLKKFPGTRVLLLVKADKELQQKFKEECTALNIRLTHPVLSPGNSRWAFCCSGEAHYSAFSAVIPGTGKNLKPLRRP